jgi:glycerol uptake facilitator-like aquaporin
MLAAAQVAAADSAPAAGLTQVGVSTTAAIDDAGEVQVWLIAAVASTPTATLVVLVVVPVVPKNTSPEVAAVAYAGTTDKSPNPSEATATTATFFNEIVFTIFLSFSQIKDDLLSGW